MTTASRFKPMTSQEWVVLLVLTAFSGVKFWLRYQRNLRVHQRLEALEKRVEGC